MNPELDIMAKVTVETARDLGFVEWGHMPRYALINGRWVAGLYFYMDL